MVRLPLGHQKATRGKPKAEPARQAAVLIEIARLNPMV
jgi:hypothetical protein